MVIEKSWNNILSNLWERWIKMFRSMIWYISLSMYMYFQSYGEVKGT